MGAVIADTTGWGSRRRGRLVRFADFLMWGADNRGWGTATRRLYALRVDQAADWMAAEGRGDLRDATRRDLREYLASTRKSGSCRAQTVRALRGYYRWLMYEEVREDDPSIWLPMVPERPGLPKPLAASEVPRILAAARAEVRGLRWHTAACTMLYAGLRSAECCCLEWANLEGDGAWLRVTGKGARTRMLPVHDVLADALAEWRRASDSLRWVFPGIRNPDGPLAYPTLRRAMLRIGEAAGVEGFHAHRLRHTYGTTLMNATGDLALVQDCMGHATPETTRVYAKVHPERMAAAVRALDYGEVRDAAATA